MFEHYVIDVTDVCSKVSFCVAEFLSVKEKGFFWFCAK